MDNLIKRIAAVLVCASLLVTARAETAQTPASDKAARSETAERIRLEEADGYKTYLSRYASAPRPAGPYTVEGGAVTDSDGAPSIVEGYAGRAGTTAVTADNGYVTWTIEVGETGLYNILVDYIPVQGKTASMIRSLEIDGKLPFHEARSLVFSRVWTDERDENGVAIQQDAFGNDLRPVQVEEPVWMRVPLRDASGLIGQPLLFYMEKGVHTLRLTALQEPMGVGGITLCQYEEPVTYEELLAGYRERGLPDATGAVVKVQAEHARLKSDQTILPESDRSTPSLEDSDPSLMRLNCIGVNSASQVGQWIEWEIVAPADGLYRIGAKTKQDFVSGANSYRRVYIDGEVPCKELDEVEFLFRRGWQSTLLSDGTGQPLLIYLEKGRHTIRLENTLGKMADVLWESSRLLEELNDIYTEILMITGPTPDINRDYEFDQTIPQTIRKMEEQITALEKLYDWMVDLARVDGANMRLIVQLLNQLKDMTKNHYSIAERFNSFQNDVDSFAAWINTTESQPLALDYLFIAPPDSPLPEAGVGFWAGLKYQAQAFIASFFMDYTSLSPESTGEAVEIWAGSGTTGGREQAQIIRQLADDTFTNTSGIPINLKVVPPAALLPAVMAGRGPDVALSQGAGDAANYAFRNASVNLREFSDYDTVAARFHPSAMVPLTYGDKVFGIPETEPVPVLFYRKDVLLNLGVDTLPETWDDVLELLPILQQRRLDFYLPSVVGGSGAAITTFAMFLMQMGCPLYTEDGRETQIASDTGLEAFSFMCELYTDYKVPQMMNFMNRFRKGSAPIGIEGYTLANQLTVFAPELNGLWDFTVIPGFRQEDGSIRRTSPGSVTASIITKRAKNPDDAWEFVKWWTNEETQAAFGRRLEGLMGAAARYPTANLGALEKIPWSYDNYRRLQESMRDVQTIPEVPGGYFMPRYIDFAVRDVIVSGKDIGNSLMNAATTINAEITRKRKEFGLDAD